MSIPILSFYSDVIVNIFKNIFEDGIEISFFIQDENIYAMR